MFLFIIMGRMIGCGMEGIKSGRVRKQLSVGDAGERRLRQAVSEAFTSLRLDLGRPLGSVVRGQLSGVRAKP
jgi:hypothetical protein